MSPSELINLVEEAITSIDQHYLIKKQELRLTLSLHEQLCKMKTSRFRRCVMNSSIDSQSAVYILDSIKGAIAESIVMYSQEHSIKDVVFAFQKFPEEIEANRLNVRIQIFLDDGRDYSLRHGQQMRADLAEREIRKSVFHFSHDDLMTTLEKHQDLPAETMCRIVQKVSVEADKFEAILSKK